MTDPLENDVPENFVFAGLHEGGYVEVELSNIEREMLRVHAQPGGPLWKIQKGLLDYRGALIENVTSLDLATEVGLTKARELLAEARAVQWQYEMWQRMLTPLPVEGEAS
jgi:hypothetical protein